MVIKSVAKTIVLDTSGRVLLLRRAKDDDSRPGEWDFPDGGIEEDEQPIDTAVREIAEEAGITLQKKGLRLVYVVTSMSAIWNMSVNRFIFAAIVPDGQTPTLSFEHEEHRWVPIKEALREFPHPQYSVALRYASENGLLEF